MAAITAGGVDEIDIISSDEEAPQSTAKGETEHNASSAPLTVPLLKTTKSTKEMAAAMAAPSYRDSTASNRHVRTLRKGEFVIMAGLVLKHSVRSVDDIHHHDYSSTNSNAGKLKSVEKTEKYLEN